MSELSSKEVRPYNPKYRRRKKYQGATWTPKNQSAGIGAGVWCKSCKLRHGYMSMGMDYNYTPSTQTFSILWKCPFTDNVLEEQKLTKAGAPTDAETV